MIDHMIPFKLRLPSVQEYEEMLHLARTHDQQCHWQSIYTLCSDRAPGEPDGRIAKGFIQSDHTDIVGVDFANARVGYRPVLEPKKQIDPHTGKGPGTVVKMGLLLLDGIPAHIPYNPVAPTATYMGDIPRYKRYDNAHIELRDAIDSLPSIPWIKLSSGALIADRVLICDISWEDLRNEGIIDGKPVTLLPPRTFSALLPSSI